MLTLLFNVFIFPIEQILSLFFVIVFRIFRNPGMSILGVSFCFSIITLPLYFFAEKYQHAERDIQARMKSEIENIKTVFSGNERFMRLAAYYRNNSYHPAYSLRASFSLLIQVPFFIAAYHFLSSLEVISGIPFGPITDLAKPDSLLNINYFSLNIMPLIMTAINIAAGAIYTKDLPKKQKFQLFGMSLIFLLLLYNSPAGLVLYWTCNNVFSLIKNIFSKIKHSDKILVILTSIICFIVAISVLFSNFISPLKRIFLTFLFIAVPFMLIVFKRFVKSKQISAQLDSKETNKLANINVFLFSIIIIFLLGSFVIPSSLISSSVHEFSFIDDYKSPIPFLINVLSQGFGLFILLPICIYFLFAENGKKIFTKFMFILSFIFVVNIFIFPGDYGPLTVLITFSQEPESGKVIILINLLVIVAMAAILFYIYRFKKVISSILVIFVCTFTVMGAINCYNITKSFNLLQTQLQYEKEITNDYKKIYKISKNGKNVIVFMLDRAMSLFIPYIFEEKPELIDSYDGFTFYKNTVSFGSNTVIGTPGLFGGYEYTPLEMQARDNVPLVEKHNEALLLLPRLFLNKGFKVTVTDPPFANYNWIPDLSIFNEYPDIYADNIVGKYTQKWFSDPSHQIEIINTSAAINTLLIRFSIFKFVPMVFRNFVYDHGRWFAFGAIKVPLTTLNNYVHLDILENITDILESDDNTYNSICNTLPHEPYFLSYPSYSILDEIEKRGDGPFAEISHYHVNVASIILLGKWLNFLKSNNVYDNTRIIIVSDHGTDLHGKYPDDIILPPNETSFLAYTSLLMIKDFNSRGKFLTSKDFMTNADVPLIALKDIFIDPVNPWTGKLLVTDKNNGVTISASKITDPEKHNKFQFRISNNEWLHIQDDIYDKENWSLVNK